jgi:chromosome partitioning protein
MHVLALVNQKGGCGKTTTAVNLAAALAARGERVLLVDLDPQAHATLSLGQAPIGGEPEVAGLLLGSLAPQGAARPVPGGFDLWPATEALAEVEEVAERMVRPEHLLEGVLEGVRARYDHVLLDCPPRADGLLTANALRACDTALLVVETGAFALQGALKALRILERLARDLDRPFAVRVVATMFDRRTRLGRELLVGMHSQFGDALFDAVIHQSQRLREAAAFGQPARVLDPGSRAATDFDELAAELVEHVRALSEAGRLRWRGAPARVEARALPYSAR